LSWKPSRYWMNWQRCVCVDVGMSMYLYGVFTPIFLFLFFKVSRDRRQLCTERCDWLRNQLQVFFSEAVKAHDSTSDHSSHELSIGSSDHSSMTSKVAATSKNVKNVSMLVGASLQHAVKHKVYSAHHSIPYTFCMRLTLTRTPLCMYMYRLQGGGLMQRNDDAANTADNFNEYVFLFFFFSYSCVV